MPGQATRGKKQTNKAPLSKPQALAWRTPNGSSFLARIESNLASPIQLRGFRNSVTRRAICVILRCISWRVAQRTNVPQIQINLQNRRQQPAGIFEQPSREGTAPKR